MIVVDASVAIKWSAPEPGWEIAQTLLKADENLAAPSHLSVETGRGLLRHHRGGQLTAAQCRTALADLRETVRLVPTEALVDAAFELAVLTSTTIYDALYVALAISENSAVVTADLRLANRLRGGLLERHVISLVDWRSRSGTQLP